MPENSFSVGTVVYVISKLVEFISPIIVSHPNLNLLLIEVLIILCIGLVWEIIKLKRK